MSANNGHPTSIPRYKKGPIGAAEILDAVVYGISWFEVDHGDLRISEKRREELIDSICVGVYALLREKEVDLQ